MVFSSNLFVYGFIPVFFALYYLTADRHKNAILLLGSVLFYTFGAGTAVWVLIVSILFNHLAAVALDRSAGRLRDAIFWISVAANLSFLLHYKYATFLSVNLTALLRWVGLPHADQPLGGELPIGISFYTFQAISYIADVYTRHVRPARRLLDFAAYHTLFPQLIAGPIVRYSEVCDAMTSRRHSLQGTAEGAVRFSIGLAKKTLLADPAGVVADVVFGGGGAGVQSSAIAWLGAVAYTLQIYYDFSGYSDMAIGLGRMLGFSFPQNFRQPYQAHSVTEFWRRWHMTLSRWFRDYLYIPLGGNRKGQLLTYMNLLAVFLLCGLWHGAGWTFVVWGLYHGTLLAVERALKQRWGIVPHGVGGAAATFVLVMLGWVIFRADSLTAAVEYLAMMFGLRPAALEPLAILKLVEGDRLPALAVGLLLITHPSAQTPEGGRTLSPLALSGAVILLLASLVTLATATFNPFIYFRF